MKIALLRDLLGEGPVPPESLARAIGAMGRPLLAARIGGPGTGRTVPESIRHRPPPSGLPPSRATRR